MKLGFVYDCKEDYLPLNLPPEMLAEFDSLATVDILAQALERLGFSLDRIGNLTHLVGRLAKGDRWDLVFNIAEGLYGAGREAAVPALLDAYRIPYVFSGPLVMATTLDKAVSKKIAAAAGVPTAAYGIVRDPSDVKNLNLTYPLFAKPVAEGSGKGVLAASHAVDEKSLHKICTNLIAQFNQPVLVETFLPGREFTVGILGSGETSHLLGVMEIGFGKDADAAFNSFHNKQLDLEEYALADDAEAKRAGEVALAAWKALGGQDCGRIDIRSDASGNPHFLEANALAGLTPGYSELPILAELKGMDFDALMEAILSAAIERHQLAWPECKRVAGTL